LLDKINALIEQSRGLLFSNDVLLYNDRPHSASLGETEKWNPDENINDEVKFC